jgi:hypothetical protein
VAALALWRHDSSDQQLQAQVIESLHTTHGTAVLFSLGLMGTNAAVFAPEVRRMMEEGFFERRYAKMPLRRIQPPAQ